MLRGERQKSLYGLRNSGASLTVTNAGTAGSRLKTDQRLKHPPLWDGVGRGGHGEHTGDGEGADQSQFHGRSPGARVARMQIVLLGMPGCYNFRVITS